MGIYESILMLLSEIYADQIPRRDAFNIPDSKVHGANMGPTWVLSAPDWPHVGPMSPAIWDVSKMMR